jgi:hypothetical protein
MCLLVRYILCASVARVIISFAKYPLYGLVQANQKYKRMSSTYGHPARRSIRDTQLCSLCFRAGRFSPMSGLVGGIDLWWYRLMVVWRMRMAYSVWRMTYAYEPHSLFTAQILGLAVEEVERTYLMGLLLPSS